MGMFDTVLVPCPRCAKDNQIQTKAGVCRLEEHDLKTASIDQLKGVGYKSPFECEHCGSSFEVEVREAIKNVTDLTGYKGQAVMKHELTYIVSVRPGEDDDDEGDETD